MFRSGLTVNVAKSEVVVFNPPSDISCTFMYNGQAMAIKNSFTYLGVLLHSACGLSEVLNIRMEKAQTAMYSVFRRCYALKLHNVEVQGRLFDALVTPVLNYGCEVWAADVLGKISIIKGEKSSEALLLNFMRQSLGVRKSTPRAAMMRELDRTPLCSMWLYLCLCFYGRIMRRPANDLVRLCMMEDLAMARSDCRSSWSYNIQACLRHIGCLNEAENMRQGHVLFAMVAREQFDQCYHEFLWADLPTGVQSVYDCPDRQRQGFKLLTYHQWFQPIKKEPAFWTFEMNHRTDIMALARFRLGSHSLQVEVGRWNGVALRSKRLCPCCTSARDDEAHIFICSGH